MCPFCHQFTRDTAHLIRWKIRKLYLELVSWILVLEIDHGCSLYAKTDTCPCCFLIFITNISGLEFLPGIASSEMMNRYSCQTHWRECIAGKENRYRMA